MVIICDIDGTIADHTHRIDYVTKHKPKNWDAYYGGMMEDPPIPGALTHLKRIIELSSPHFYFMTGRPERYRYATTEWIYRHFGVTCRKPGGIPGVLLYMRSDQDYRASSVYKEELPKYLVEVLKTPVLFLDDDLRNEEMYRKYGVFLKAPECWDVIR